jgi:antitoxin YefM
MKVMGFSEARANFAKMLDAVVDDAEETVIHRSGKEPVVVISLAEWNSMKETDYLLRSPTNANRLLRSIAQANAGQAQEHPLTED